MAALSEIEKLEARFNENPEGRFFAPLADAYRKAGRVDDAIVMVTSNIPKHPDYLSAHIVLGRCLLDKKDDNGASRAFERVLELDGENIIALKSLAEIAERMGSTDDARRWLMRLLTVDQMNSEAEDDLQRLGGPIQDPSEAPAVEAPPMPHISFADLAEPELPEPPPPPPPPPPAPPPMGEEKTVPVPAVQDYVVPRTIERFAVKPPPFAMSEDKTLGFTPPPPAPPAPPEPTPAPMFDLEPTSFTAPTERAPAISPDLVPFDDQLKWGAGERQSQSIHQEDLAAAEAMHEATSPAIDFLGSVPPAEAPAQPASELDLAQRKETKQRVSESEWEGFGSSPTDAAEEKAPPPLVLDAPMEPPTVSTHEEPAPADLPLIMPEDVTPAEEMRRPSHKQVQIVSPDEAPVPEGAGAAMVTETMGDLYLQQGLKPQAADVYRQILASRPDDTALKAKLAALETHPAMSAAAMGTEAVGSWLRRIARSVLPTGAAPEPPPAPSGSSPMDAAFAEPEPASAASSEQPTAADVSVAQPEPAAEAAPEPAAAAAAQPPSGEPARPASTAFSLDQIFGAPATSAAPSSQAPPPASKHALGASFDEFFGATPAPAESARPKEGEAPKPGEDDLSAFNAWLHGLKG